MFHNCGTSYATYGGEEDLKRTKLKKLQDKHFCFNADSHRQRASGADDQRDYAAVPIYNILKFLLSAYAKAVMKQGHSYLGGLNISGWCR